MKTKTTKKNKKLFLGDDKEQKISTLAMVISLVVVVKGVFICFALMAVCYRYILLPNLINVKPICCLTMFIVFMIFLSLFLFTILLYSLQHVCSLTTHAPKWNNKRRGDRPGCVNWDHLPRGGVLQCVCIIFQAHPLQAAQLPATFSIVFAALPSPTHRHYSISDGGLDGGTSVYSLFFYLNYTFVEF